jgi:DNA-binding PadR family transcriptional regulator
LLVPTFGALNSAAASSLIIQLRKLEEADYLSTEKTRNGSAQKTTVALTSHGRKALSAYTQALRDLLGGL